MATKNRFCAVALLLASGLLLATTGACGGDSGALLGSQELQAPDQDADAPVTKPSEGDTPSGKTADASTAKQGNDNPKSDGKDAGKGQGSGSEDGGEAGDGGAGMAGDGGLGLGQKCNHNRDCASKLCIGFKNNKVCL